jgi:hypothetical protein
LQLGQALLFFRILGRKVTHIFPKLGPRIALSLPSQFLEVGLGLAGAVARTTKAVAKESQKVTAPKPSKQLQNLES